MASAMPGKMPTMKPTMDGGGMGDMGGMMMWFTQSTQVSIRHAHLAAELCSAGTVHLQELDNPQSQWIPCLAPGDLCLCSPAGDSQSSRILLRNKATPCQARQTPGPCCGDSCTRETVVPLASLCVTPLQLRSSLPYGQARNTFSTSCMSQLTS